MMILAMGMVFVSQANAQAGAGASTTAPEVKDTSTSDGWHAFITPYIWFSGVHGTSGALGHEAAVDALFGARIWHLDTTLTLQPVELETGFSQATTWADAVAG